MLYLWSCRSGLRGDGWWQGQIFLFIVFFNFNSQCRMEFCPPLLEKLSTSSWAALVFCSARHQVGLCRRPILLAMSIDHAKSTPLSCLLSPTLSQDGMTLAVVLLLICLLSTCVSPLYWWQQLRTQRQISAVHPICIFNFSFSLLIRVCGWTGCKQLKTQGLTTGLKSSLASRPCSAFPKWAQNVYQEGSFGNTCLVPVWKGICFLSWTTQVTLPVASHPGLSPNTLLIGEKPGTAQGIETKSTWM